MIDKVEPYFTDKGAEAMLEDWYSYGSFLAGTEWKAKVDHVEIKKDTTPNTFTFTAILICTHPSKAEQTLQIAGKSQYDEKGILTYLGVSGESVYEMVLKNETLSRNLIADEVSTPVGESGLEDQKISAEPTYHSSDDTEMDWTYEQELDENDVDLDGVSYDDLTSMQVVMLFTELLSEGDEQRLNVLMSDDLLGKWGISNTLFHGITPQSISDAYVETSTYRPLPEPHEVLNTDSDARYELRFHQGENGFFAAQPENVSLFVDLKKIDGYWKIDLWSTSP